MQNKREERIGEVNYNSQGERMEIIDYINHKDITVRFEDGTIREHIFYIAFKNGQVKNPMSAMGKYGVISGFAKMENHKTKTKEYRSWQNMISRCYNPKRYEKFPGYKNCYVCDEWFNFHNFEEWCHSQDNWESVQNEPSRYNLDKDIIVKGNKIYSPENCCFVPYNVNILFTKRNKARGKFPIGVSYTKHMDTYQSACRDPFTHKHINHYGFSTPEKAFEQYKKDKEEVIKKVAIDEYNKGTITTKCYEAMMNYEVEITD